MADQLHQARDTRANWVSNNPVLGAGEIGIQTDDGAIKIGDGSSAWTALPYSSTPTKTSMPASPQSGQRVFRSDNELIFHWDGTRWVTELHQLIFQHSPSTYWLTDDLAGLLPTPYKGTYDLFMESVNFHGFLNVTGNWTHQLEWVDGALGSTTITSDSVSAVATWVSQTNTLNSVLDANADGFRYFVDEISGSSRFYGGCILNYRLIGA